MRPALRAAVFALAFAGAASAPSDDDARARSLEFQKKAREAYERKDWPAFLANAKEAEALRPGGPSLVYNLACAQARNENAGEAARLLESLLDRKMDLGSETDEDFAVVASSPAFAGVREKLRALRRPVGGSAVAFRLPEKDLLTEGIAYDPQTRAFFVSSVHRRKIVRRAADGTVSDFVTPGRDGLLGVLAIAVDPKARRLYACSAALPEMRGYEKTLEAGNGVLAFDLATGRLAGRWTLPASDRRQAPGDLLVADGGNVLVSDGLGSGVYRIRPGKREVETVVAPGAFRSPQGMGYGPGGALYVADYGSGLFRLDASGTPQQVPGPPDVPLYGIDALLVRGRRIYATQNGIAPHRVVRLELDESGSRVATGEILDMNDPEFAEPTLAALVGEDLYVVGKSQWGLFEKGEPDAAKLQEPAVLRVKRK
jgi:sugar lactone lactonase YvrE